MSRIIMTILRKIVAQLNINYNAGLEITTTTGKQVVIKEPHVYDDGSVDDSHKTELSLKWFSFYYSGTLCLSKFLTPCEIALAEINIGFKGV